MFGYHDIMEPSPPSVIFSAKVIKVATVIYFSVYSLSYFAFAVYKIRNNFIDKCEIFIYWVKILGLFNGL